MQIIENKGYFLIALAATVAFNASLLCTPDKAWNGPVYSALL
jgi:hypothetical protein